MFDFAKALAYHTCFSASYARIVAFDFETTGVNLHHESEPFMMAATFNDGESLLWEGQVDPQTRCVTWSPEDIAEIIDFFDHADWLYVASNAKFDCRCAEKAFGIDGEELLSRTHDTLLQHHVLNNNESHALKDAAVKYAKIPDTDESDLHAAVVSARVIAKKLGWAVASKTTCPTQRRAPSAKKSGWSVMDMWLPAALARHMWETSDAYYHLQHMPSKPVYTIGKSSFSLNVINRKDLDKLRTMQGWEWRPADIEPDYQGHSWWTLCAKYCSFDTLRSVVLYQKFSEALVSEGFLQNYLENRTSLPISYATEQRGVAINVDTAKALILKFQKTKRDAAYALNASINAKVPINPGSSTALRNILYGYFKLPVTRYTKPAKASSVPKPTTDADFVAEIVREFTPAPEDIHAPPIWQEGVEPFQDFKKRLSYWYQMLISEEKPSLPQIHAFAKSLLVYKKAETSIRYLEGYLASAQPVPSHTSFALLHPSFNPIGTKTTRYSSSNPNGQNISKGGRAKKGMEWLDMGQNSLRSVFGPLPGREWWSFDYSQIQLVIFAILSGDDKMIAAVRRGEHFHKYVAREIFEKASNDELEEWQIDVAKTANFAFIFGAKEDKLNRSSGIPGLYRTLGDKFPSAIDFLQRTEWEVRDHGFITTPGGYRLYVPEETPYAGVNYKVQGAEGEIFKRGQCGLSAYLGKVLSSPEDYFLTMQVHDDLIYDAPIGQGYQHVGPTCRIMQDAALSYGFPVRVQPKYTTTSWADMKKVVVG